MYRIKLKIKNYAELNIYTTSEMIKNSLTIHNAKIKRTIPITSVYSEVIDKDDILYEDAVIISDQDKSSMYYDKNYNVSILNTNDKLIRLPDLTYVCLAMFSKILSRNQKYLIHSSALVHSLNDGIILIGDANAGKTSLAYELLSKNNCKLISNDHTIVGIEDGIPMILGGTKDVQMRIGAIELYFPELYKKVNLECEDKWEKKIIVNDMVDLDLILDESSDKVPISDIYSISTANIDNFYIRNKAKIDQSLFLYESLTKILKGTYNYINGFNYPMPSMEDEKNLFEIINFCETVVERANVYEAKGSVKQLAKELVGKYEK